MAIRFALANAASLAVLGMVLLTGRAEPCSAPCPVPKPAPRNGSTVPSNIPALVVVPNGATDSTSEVRLLDSNGAEVPFVIDPLTAAGGPLTIRPSAPLQSNSHYSLRYGPSSDSACMPGGYVESAFSTQGVVSLPTSIGEVRVTTELGPYQVPTGSGSCVVDTAQAALAHIAITPTPELEAFLPMARWALEVDGAPWATSTYGEPLTPVRSRSFKTVHAACAPLQQGDDMGLPPGSHRGVLRVSIPGMEAPIPPHEFNFELSCNPSESNPATTSEPGQSQTGCAAAGGNPLLGLPWLFLAAAPLWVRKSRRRTA